MADAGRIATDKALEAMEKKLAGIYRRSMKELKVGWTDYLDTVNEEIKSAQDEYDSIKATGDKDEIAKAGRALAALKREKTLQDTRYKAMTEQLAKKLTEVNQEAVAYVNGRLPAIYATNYNYTGQAIAEVVGKTYKETYAFDLVNAQTVKRLATTNKTLLPYKIVDGRKDERWNTKKVNSEVLQGILQGESIPKIADRLSNVVGMNLASSIRNARTSVTGAENRGRQDSFEAAAEQGIELEREWITVHDNRVREAHDELDGVTVGVDEPFHNSLGDIMYPGDPNADPGNVYNCRCSVVARVKGFGRR